MKKVGLCVLMAIPLFLFLGCDLDQTNTAPNASGDGILSQARAATYQIGVSQLTASKYTFKVGEKIYYESYVTNSSGTTCSKTFYVRYSIWSGGVPIKFMLDDAGSDKTRIKGIAGNSRIKTYRYYTFANPGSYGIKVLVDVDNVTGQQCGSIIWVTVTN